MHYNFLCNEKVALLIRGTLVHSFRFESSQANLVYYNQEHFGFLDKGNFGNHTTPAVSIACTNRLQWQQGLGERTNVKRRERGESKEF